MPRSRDDVLVNPKRRLRKGDRGCPGHVGRACPKGILFHCPVCDQDTTHSWDAIEESLTKDRDPTASNTVRLPPCPCGARAWLTINEEPYEPGSQDDLTSRAVHEQVMPRLGWTGLRIQPLCRHPVIDEHPPTPAHSPNVDHFAFRTGSLS